MEKLQYKIAERAVCSNVNSKDLTPIYFHYYFTGLEYISMTVSFFYIIKIQFI